MCGKGESHANIPVPRQGSARHHTHQARDMPCHPRTFPSGQCPPLRYADQARAFLTQDPKPRTAA